MSGRRADRQGRRTAERAQTRLHVPLVNRTPDVDPPPVIVAIVGPPGVGKTTLMKSLIRRYSKQTLNDIKGPVTVVAGKNKRLTFIECNNDLNSMIDVGKIADLVLLMIDGSFGFEMVRLFFVQHPNLLKFS
jgi:ribosome biogenesis protein BMS1